MVDLDPDLEGTNPVDTNTTRGTLAFRLRSKTIDTHTQGLTDRFPNLDLLTLLHRERKVQRRLKDQNDRTPQHEPTHLIPRVQRLSPQQL